MAPGAVTSWRYANASVADVWFYPLDVGLAAGPVTRVCHVCGRQYGLSSFEIHLKQCKKLWVQQARHGPLGLGLPICGNL